MNATCLVSGSTLTTMKVSVREPLTPMSSTFSRPLVQSGSGGRLRLLARLGVAEAPGASDRAARVGGRLAAAG